MTLLWDELYQEPEPEPELQDIGSEKPGPVVTKRKRQGLQLCNVFNPAKPPKWTEVIFEPKLDGYRCIARVENGKATLVTSTQLPFGPNVRFLVEYLEAAAVSSPEDCDNVVYDGEITHLTLPFKVMGGILRDTSEHPEAEGMIYTVWDQLTIEEYDTKTSYPLASRKLDLRIAAEQMSAQPRRVFPVDFVKGTIADVESCARTFVGQGYEGIVLKNAQGLYCYEGKAGTNWLKWKPKFDGETVLSMLEGDFVITGAKEGRGKHKGRLGAIDIKGYLLPDGNIQPDAPDSGPIIEITGSAGTGQALTDAGRTSMWKQHQHGFLIGRCVEVRYQEVSAEGTLRFPSLYRMREDKDV